MSQQIAQESQYHAIEWDREIDAVRFTWKEYEAGEAFQTSLTQLHNAIEEAGTDKYLVDTRAITAHDDEDKQWITETWIPRLIDSGVRSGVSVYPESAISEMDMDGIEDSVNAIDDRFTFRAFTDIVAAREWLEGR